MYIGPPRSKLSVSGARRAPVRPSARRDREPGCPPPPPGRRPRAPVALGLRVELGTEQHRQVGDPHPHQEHDHAAQRAVGLVVGAELATRRRRSPPRRRSRRARPPRCRARPSGSRPPSTFGAAQYRIASMNITTTTSTGHLAKFQPSRPCRRARPRSPTASATGPVTISASTTSAASSTRTSVTSELQRAAASRTAAPPRLVDRVRRAHERADVARRRPQRDGDADDQHDAGRLPVLR